MAEKTISDEARKLLEGEDDAKAVKLARESLGLSLVEAKQYVDALKLHNK